MLDNLPPLREVLERHDLMPKKALGQNFILDSNVTAKIARSAGDLFQFNVIEIGPGPGGLTRALLLAGAKSVIAVEKDERCKAALAELIDAADGRLQLMEADALTVKLEDIAPAPRALVANLPYNVATPLLINWLEEIAENPSVVSRLSLMFQKEVAERIAASPNSKAYGRLAVMTQWLCTVRHGFDLAPEIFFPPPKITSSVIHLEPRAQKLADVPFAVMERVVEKAFNQRRKMLRQALKGLDVTAETLLAEAGIEPTLRAEQLSVAQFGELALAYQRCKGKA